MKISSLVPIIITGNPQKVLRFHEKLGFKVIHISPPLTDDKDEYVYVLENEKGAHIDVVYHKTTTVDKQAFRINVDNFDEALELYVHNGFKILIGPKETDSALRVLLTQDGVNEILLVKHLN